MRYDPPFHKSNGLVPGFVVLAGLIVLPWIFDASYARHLMILVFVFGVVAASWDLSLGYGGLFNFAHVALFAVGIYTYAILAKTLGVNPWIAMLAAGPVAVLVALIISLPVLRLDGIYVILVTIAFSQLIYQIIISQSSITGGTSGMVTLPALSIGDYRFTKDGRIGYYYTGLMLLVSACAFLHATTRSKWGRAIVALRDAKYAAISRGVPEARTRAITLAASGLFTGIAGGFYGSYVRVASPDIFGLGSLTLILSILLVGGIGTIWGPVAAAFVIVLLSEAMADFGPWREIAIAVLIILVMVLYPGGVWGIIQEMREALTTWRGALLARLRRARGLKQREALLFGSEVMIKTRHGKIAVSDTGGNKPVILAIHGNSACKEAYTKLFAAFHDTHRLIAFDLPGHGVSDNGDPETAYNVAAYADVAEDVLAHAKAKNVTVLGWSLGGYVGLEMTARCPSDFAGLVITGTSPLNIVPDDFARGYNASGHLVLAGKQYFTRTEQHAYASSATAPYSNESAFMHRNIGRTDGRTRYYMITKLGVVDWPRQMRMLREGLIPVAVLNGSDDPFLDHDYIAGLEYGNIWRGGPRHIPDGQHAPFFNKADEFNECFAAFMKWARGQDATTETSVRIGGLN